MPPLLYDKGVSLVRERMAPMMIFRTLTGSITIHSTVTASFSPAPWAYPEFEQMARLFVVLVVASIGAG